MKFPLEHKIKRPFDYTTSVATDLADTFRRIRRVAARQQRDGRKVVAISKRKAKA